MRFVRARRRAYRSYLVVRSMLRSGQRPLSVSACVSGLNRATIGFERAERQVMLERARIIAHARRRGEERS